MYLTAQTTITKINWQKLKPGNVTVQCRVDSILYHYNLACHDSRYTN